MMVWGGGNDLEKDEEEEERGGEGGGGGGIQVEAPSASLQNSDLTAVVTA